MLPYFPSNAINIRDEAFLRIRQINGITSVLKAHPDAIKPENLPCVVISHGGDRAENMGDPNCGPPEFEHTFTLHVELITKAGNTAALDARSTSLNSLILAKLFTDPTFVELFEGIRGCDQKVDYGPLQASGADYCVHIATSIDLTYRSIWEPDIPNYFEKIGISTKLPDLPDFSNPFFIEYEVNNDG